MTMNRRLAVVTVVLVTTLGFRAYLSAAPSTPPLRRSLEQFPKQLHEWTMTGESRISDDVAGVLKADEYINRRYRSPELSGVDVFIAYYQTQRAGESMHSPKNCLPGSGWAPVLNDYVMVPRASGAPVQINRYVIEKDNSQSVVLYWYQAGGRVIANEYWGKLYLVYDALRTQRRDGSIVRIVVPMRGKDDLARATNVGLGFVGELMDETPKFLP